MDVTTSIVIDRPRDEVSSYAADPGRAPLWSVNIRTVAWKSEPPLAVGSRFEFMARFLRRTLIYTYQVAEYIPGERLVMRAAEGPFPMETTYVWDAVDPNHTRMTLRNRGNPSGFARLVAPFMSLAMRRANRNDLRRLKNNLEHRLRTRG